MRGDLLRPASAEAVPQVPAVADLHRAGQRLADGLAVGARAVTAHDLDPGWSRSHFPAKSAVRPRHDVDPTVSASMSTGRVDQAAAQREVVDPQHPRHRQHGKRNPEQDVQHRVPGGADAQRRHQPRRGPAR